MTYLCSIRNGRDRYNGESKLSIIIDIKLHYNETEKAAIHLKYITKIKCI